MSMKLVRGPNHQIPKMPESSASDCRHLVLFSTTPWDYILMTAYHSRIVLDHPNEDSPIGGKELTPTK